MQPGPLNGLWVMVTRPEDQAASLCTAIRASGAQVLRWPTIALSEPREPHRARAVVDRLDEFDLAIFVSVNAVQWGLAPIQAQQQTLRDLPVLAVGKGTAAALRDMGTCEPLCPKNSYNSEGLLAMDELSQERVDGRRVLIFKGEGGRELLADTLRKRGAQVTHAEVYRRTKPDSDPRVVASHWQRGELDVILVSSAEGLHNLVELLGPGLKPRLLDTQLLVVGERVARKVRTLGFQRTPVIVDDLGEGSVVQALIAWHQSGR